MKTQDDACIGKEYGDIMTEDQFFNVLFPNTNKFVYYMT